MNQRFFNPAPAVVALVTVAVAMFVPATVQAKEVAFLVKDINPGEGSSIPSVLTNVGAVVFFLADDGEHGEELWKSDGTEAGTVLVKDITPGSGGSSVSFLTNVNGTLFFSANDGVMGDELWKSDGTEAGTVLVKDIKPGLGGFHPQLLTNVNGTLFFTEDRYDLEVGEGGPELWKSDGTEAGTVLVKEVHTGLGWRVSISLIRNVNGTLFFYTEWTTRRRWSRGKLWVSDGTEAGTVPAWLDSDASLVFLETATKANGTLFFHSWDRKHGGELFTSFVALLEAPCDELLPSKVKKILFKKAKRTDRLLKKADGAAAKDNQEKITKLRQRAAVQLQAITTKARRSKKLLPDCKAAIEQLVTQRQQAIEGLAF